MALDRDHRAARQSFHAKYSLRRAAGDPAARPGGLPGGGGAVELSDRGGSWQCRPLATRSCLDAALVPRGSPELRADASPSPSPSASASALASKKPARPLNDSPLGATLPGLAGEDTAGGGESAVSYRLRARYARLFEDFMFLTDELTHYANRPDTRWG